MMVSRQGIQRMLASLAVSHSQTAAAAGLESLAAEAGELFAMPGVFAGRVAPADKHVRAAWIETLAGEIRGKWARERLVFKTSGSTGVPGACVQDVALLFQEARFLAGLFRGTTRVVSLVPAHHIYGFLFTVLLPELLGVPVADLDALSLGSLPGTLEPGDVVVGFPLLWKKSGELGTVYPPGITGVTSTGPCPTDVVQQAVTSGLARMAEIHGSTETGGLGYRFSPLEPYRLMDHWISSPQGGALRRVSPSGGPPVAFALPDELAWEGERLYRPAGRKDKAVQIAGVNVYPERVRRVLLGHPLVADAVVRPMSLAEGDRLKAFIVARDPCFEEQAVIRELRGYVSATLIPPEIPRSFTFGPALPRGPLGKDADWDISGHGTTNGELP